MKKLDEDHIVIKLKGSAGQSFGAFSVQKELHLEVLW